MKGKSIDFSNPKYQSSEERYREFLRQRKLQAEKVGFPVTIVNDATMKSNEQTKNCSETVEPVNFNPNLDLDRRESMKNTKIDACSVQTGPSINIKADLIAQNLLSIHISPDSSYVQESANVRTYEINHDFSLKQPSSIRKEKLVKIPNENQTNYETKAKEFNEIENENPSACTCVSKQVNIQGSGLIVENEKNLQSNNVQNTSLDTIENSIENQEKGKEKSVKVRFKSFDDPSVSKKETNDQCTPLSVNEIETRRLMNKKRHEEICGKQKSKKDERYKRIDQRFSDLLNKYCTQQTKSNHFIRQDSSEHSDLIVTPFYEPYIDQFDNLLTTYGKIIDNVVLSTKTIDKFLSRAEFKNEFLNCESKPGTSKSNHVFRPLRRKEQPIVSKYRSRKSSIKKNINNDVQRIGGYNNSRKSFFLSKRSNRVSTTIAGQNEESTESSKNPEESSSFNKFSTEILPTFQVENNDGSSFDTCSSSSKKSRNIVNKETTFQVSKQAENLRTEKIEEVKEIEGKNGSDRATLYDVTCSKILKEIQPDTENMERSIVRVVREETRFIEEKVKNVFNLDEIVPLLAKGLLDNLRNNISNFQPKSLVPNPLPNDAAFTNVPTFNKKEENFRLTENVTTPIVVEQTNEIHSKSLEKETDASMQNFQEENLCETLSKGSTTNTNQNASFVGDTISKSSQQHSVKPNSVENPKKEQISSSDSLHDCASLQSSKNCSGTFSNVVQSSGKSVNEVKQISEINNKVANEEINANNSLCGPFEKDQILSQLYQDMDQRFFSSTFNTNYSNLLNQHLKLSSSISTIESKVRNHLTLQSYTLH